MCVCVGEGGGVVVVVFVFCLFVGFLKIRKRKKIRASSTKNSLKPCIRTVNRHLGLKD